MRCRFRTPVVAAVSCAVAALIWLRIRRRAAARRSAQLIESADSQNKNSSGSASAGAAAARCPYADAEVGGYVRLPVFVQVDDLPTGVSVAPVLTYPPRHAVVPFVLQDDVEPCEGELAVAQALLCCEDITTCAADGKHSEFSGDVSSQDAMSEVIRTYVAHACPFLRNDTSSAVDVVCAPLEVAAAPQGVFTHMVASPTFCAFVGHLQGSSTVVSCVLVLAPQPRATTATAALEALRNSTRWMALAASVRITQPLPPSNNSGIVTTAFGKGRLRVAAKSLRTGRVVTTAVSPCPYVASVRVELDEVIETDTPTLLLVDGVDGIEHRIPLFAPVQPSSEPNSPGGTRQDQSLTTAEAMAHNVVAPSPSSQVSSSLEASAMEAWSEADTKPLILYTNDVVGVSLACSVGSSFHEVRFASRPTVTFSVPVESGVGCDTTVTSRSPVLTIERVRTLPEEWEQASSAFTSEDFFELLQHNITYCLTPWETLLQRPDIQTSELSGFPTWVFHEEREGMRCRTYVCLHLQKFGGSAAGSRLLRGSGEVVVPSKVVELMLVRWETCAEDWDESLPTLRKVLDRLHIDFN